MAGLKTEKYPDAYEERGDDRSHRQHDLLLAQQEGHQHLSEGEMTGGRFNNNISAKTISNSWDISMGL